MKNIYKPFRVEIVKIENHSSDVKLFRLRKERGNFSVNDQGLSFDPGQFILISNFGYGEAPFGIASSPFEAGYVDIIVRRVGCLTKSLHRLKKGDQLFLRGPLGHGFPIDFMSGHDVIMVTGGCGIPPIAALAEYIIEKRWKFDRVYLVYGARKPADLLMKEKLEKWGQDIKVILTVDQPDKSWKGYVGMVSKIVKEIKINPLNAVAAMCGPGPMMDALEQILRPLGVSDRRIFVNMERKMQCGVGKCQHCVVGDKYVCQDGPVFNFDQIDKSWD